MSPVQRSLAWLKEHGYDPVRKVEVWNSYAKIRQDLWGFDILAVLSDQITFIQVTDGAHLAEHIAKLFAMATTYKLKKTGARLIIHSWSKLGPRGKRKTWQLKEVAI